MSKDNNRWIECSDRLPESSTSEFVEFGYPNLLLFCNEDGISWIDIGWFSNLDNEDVSPYFFTNFICDEHTGWEIKTNAPNVTHWQTLPPPPTE